MISRIIQFHFILFIFLEFFLRPMCDAPEEKIGRWKLALLRQYCIPLRGHPDLNIHWTNALLCGCVLLKDPRVEVVLFLPPSLKPSAPSSRISRVKGIWGIFELSLCICFSLLVCLEVTNPKPKIWTIAKSLLHVDQCVPGPGHHLEVPHSLGRVRTWGGRGNPVYSLRSFLRVASLLVHGEIVQEMRGEGHVPHEGNHNVPVCRPADSKVADLAKRVPGLLSGPPFPIGKEEVVSWVGLWLWSKLPGEVRFNRANVA